MIKSYSQLLWKITKLVYNLLVQHVKHIKIREDFQIQYNKVKFIHKKDIKHNIQKKIYFNFKGLINLYQRT